MIDLSPICTGWHRSFPTSFVFLIPTVGVRAVGDRALTAGQDNQSYMLAAGRTDRASLIFFPASNIPSQRVEAVGSKRGIVLEQELHSLGKQG